MAAAAGAEVTTVLLELGAITVGLSVLARLGHRTGVSPIPFYLLGGLVVSATGVIDPPADLVSVGSEIGVLLLLFLLGLEYTAEELRGNLRAGLPAGILDLVLNLTPGVALGLLLGW